MDKRHRATNFSDTEIILLLTLIEKYKNIVENKKSDAVTRKEKDNVWAKIATEHVASSQISRSVVELRNKFENLKRQLKKKVADNKIEMFKTGGGTPNIKSLSVIEERIRSILSISVDGLSNSVDSDHSSANSEDLKMKDSSSDDNNELEIIEIVVDTPEQQTAGPSWEEWSPKLLQTPKNKQLCIPRVEKSNRTRTISAGETNKKFAHLADAKLELVALQIEYLNTEERRKEEFETLKQEKFMLEMEYLRKKEELELEAKKLQILLLKKQLEK